MPAVKHRVQRITAGTTAVGRAVVVHICLGRKRKKDARKKEIRPATEPEARNRKLGNLNKENEK